VVFVIVATGNHFPVDAAADAAIAGVALVAAPLLVTPPSIARRAVRRQPSFQPRDESVVPDGYKAGTSAREPAGTRVQT
jgi:hypothetical protein